MNFSNFRDAIDSIVQILITANIIQKYFRGQNFLLQRVKAVFHNIVTNGEFFVYVTITKSYCDCKIKLSQNIQSQR